MADDECKVCTMTPCACTEIEDAANWLLAHPTSDLRIAYTDVRACWPVMEALRRRVLTAAKAERKRCADFVSSQASRYCVLIQGDKCGLCRDLANELERLPES